MAKAGGRQAANGQGAKKPVKATTTAKAREKKPLSNQKAALALWGSRDQSQPGNPIQVRTRVNDLVPVIKEQLRDQGRFGHLVGSTAAWLFHVHADVLYGQPDFLTFLKVVLGLGRTQAYRYARIARFANAKQAEWGEDAVIQAAAIVELIAARPLLQRKFKLASPPGTLTDIAHLELPLEGKQTLRLDRDEVTLPALETAFEKLGGKVATAGAARLSEADKQAHARLQEAVASDPELQGVEARLSKGPSGTRLVLKIPSGRNIERVAQALARALGG